MTPQQILDLCRSCAAEVYGNRAPTEAYAERVALLLAGTAATESHFKYDRQQGFSYDQDRGAWGLWQTEGLPMRDNLRLLQRNSALCERACSWAGLDWTAANRMRVPALLRVVAAVPRVACMFARIHYMRFPAPVPGHLTQQAAYYKKHYNTIEGKGSVAKYLSDWVQHVEPMVGGVA